MSLADILQRYCVQNGEGCKFWGKDRGLTVQFRPMISNEPIGKNIWFLRSLPKLEYWENYSEAKPFDCPCGCGCFPITTAKLEDSSNGGNSIEITLEGLEKALGPLNDGKFYIDPEERTDE